MNLTAASEYTYTLENVCFLCVLDIFNVFDKVKVNEEKHDKFGTTRCTPLFVRLSTYMMAGWILTAVSCYRVYCELKERRLNLNLNCIQHRIFWEMRLISYGEQFFLAKIT